ncbi:LppU/SCO3897 family protein [Nocardia cyriacigeorgica]|uniref:LppU/SCO3897 family protein n=1 Tax=Nocardia cyriacigeorgica TaxID=135487 RepID=UPI0034DAC6CC
MTEPMSGNDNPTPSRSRRRMTNTALIVAIGAFVTAGILIVGVTVLASSFESTVAEAKQGATSTTAATTTASSPAKPAPATQPGLAPPVTTTSKTTTTSATPIAANKTAKEAVALKVDVGDCVVLDPDPKKVGTTACGSPDSTYRVVDKTGEGGSCPSDADHSHSVDKTTLCLDIDWTVGSCMTLKPTPARIPCTSPDGVKVVAVKQNTTEVDTCPDADRGFVYSERKFVICFADL